jgi:hypothetical protein
LCFVHAVFSVLDTWYYSTHDRCAVFLIPYSPYCCVNHALFPLLFAPETKVAVLTRSSQTVVCDLQVDTFFFGVPEHCLRNLQWNCTVWYVAMLPVLQYRSFVSVWLVKNLAELVDRQTVCETAGTGYLFCYVVSANQVSLSLSTWLSHFCPSTWKFTDQKSANDL